MGFAEEGFRILRHVNIGLHTEGSEGEEYFFVVRSFFFCEFFEGVDGVFEDAVCDLNFVEECERFGVVGFDFCGFFCVGESRS